jgi:cell division protein FtsQ
VKLFRRRKAIAAGTVQPADVFGPSAADAGPDASGEPISEGVVVIDTPAAATTTGATDVTTTPATRATPPATEADTSTTAPSPSTAPASASDGPTPPVPDSARPMLRFGFDPPLGLAFDPPPAVQPVPAAAPHVNGDADAVVVPLPVTAPVRVIGGEDGAVATKPRKVISIGSDADLDEIETTAFDPSPVDLARPEVEPRLRARRIQVRREAGRKRLRWVVVGVVVLLLLAGAGVVLDSPIFSINDVEVTGATYTNRARLQGVIDDLDGSTLMGADLHKAEATLAADPWVKRVRVTRRPLRGVRIEIVERTPAATYMGKDQRWRVLDPTGRVLAVLSPPGSKPVDPLELKLAKAGPDLAASADAPSNLAAAADLVPRLPDTLRNQTCSMTVADSGGLKLNLCKGNYVIDLGQPEQLRDKLITVLYLLTAQAPAVAASRGMNVSDPFNPVLIKK